MAADVGGTITHLALFQIKEEQFSVLSTESYHTRDFNSFMEMVGAFHGKVLPAIDSICLGVAGPVTDGIKYMGKYKVMPN